jgi:adenylate cyclase
MGLAEKLDSDISTIFQTTWKTRDGVVVPGTDDVALKDGAVKLEATVLYADLFHSTELARKFNRSVAAKIVRAYLSSMTQIVKAFGGEVRSFDGDRVMGVFVGGSKNTNAAKCALKMKYVVEKSLRPKAEAQFPSLTDKGFKIQHCAGVARSSVFVVRGGVRGSNDLVFVGSSPNIAAKLSETRNPPYNSYITSDVYKNMSDKAKFSGGKSMWEKRQIKLADEEWECYRSSWRWKP